MRRPLAVPALVLAAAGWAAHLAWTLPTLPDPVATRFDGAGAVNAWMSHLGVVLMQVLVLGFTAAVLFGVTSLVPPHLINVRNRDYWFAPERVAQGMAKLRAWMCWFQAGFFGFFIGQNALIAHAHAHHPPRLPGGALLTMLGGTLVALGLWLWGLWRTFRLPAAGRAR